MPMHRSRRKLSFYALYRRQTAIPAQPPLAAQIASLVATVWAQKRTSGSAAIFRNRIGANTLASPDRIREKLSLSYDAASDAGVAAKSEADSVHQLGWDNRE